MTTPITAEIQSLSPSALLEMFELDMTARGGGFLRFHAGTNALTQPVVWQGNTYQPLPIEASGFDKSGRGTLPRPKVRVANIDGLFSALVREEDDLIGCKLTRKRTFARYLDAVNFPGGTNPEADPNQHLPDDLWFVERKVSEDRYIIEWELASAFDLQGVMLPYRQVVKSTCVWKYRGSECGYTGESCFDINDNPVVNPLDDVCGKRLRSCELRHGTGATVNLPFGAFPGSLRYD